MLHLVEERFTQKKLITLQRLLTELNQLVCAIDETPSKLLDRFHKIVLGVNAIDPAQLPTELQLITSLKNAISGQFKLLNVMLLTMVNLTLVQLKEKFMSWEIKFEIGAGHGATERHVANFAGANYDDKRKKAFVKKVKSGRTKAKQIFLWFVGTVIRKGI